MKILNDLKTYKIMYKYNEMNFTTYILGIDELDSLNSFIVHCKLLNIPLNNKIHIYIKLEKNDK